MCPEQDKLILSELVSNTLKSWQSDKQNPLTHLNQFLSKLSAPQRPQLPSIEQTESDRLEKARTRIEVLMKQNGVAKAWEQCVDFYEQRRYIPIPEE